VSEAPAFAADESSRAREDVVARGPRPAVRALVQFVALSAIGIGLFMFHGISLQLTPWSQAIVNGIVKYAYPATGQKDTTVVLFREENLAELDEAYPVSYQRHAEVLEALSAYEPRAVFVDFAFIDPRSPEDTERLGQAICELSAGGRVPVYLASPPPAAAGHGDSEINQPLLACAKPVSAEMDAERGVSGVLTYQNGVCTTPEAGRPCKRSAFMPSPAFAMAAARAGIAPADAEPMEIIWGNLASSLNEKWMNCTTVGPLQHLVEMLRETPLATKRKCPHTNTISVVHLLGAEDPDVRDAIRGKSVFYGGSFQMVGDRVKLTVAGGSVDIAATELLDVEPEDQFPAPPAANADFSVRYASYIRASAQKHNVDERLVAGVIAAESNFDAKAVSRKRALGLMQLLPSTAARYSVTNVFDPAQNIEAGTHYLRDLLDRYRGDTRLALAAYNAGPEMVDRYGGVPPFAETQRYVRAITAKLAAGDLTTAAK